MSSKFQLPSQLKAVPQELPQVAPDELREFLAGAKDHRSSPEALPGISSIPKLYLGITSQFA